MGGRMSRQKGARGEREVIGILQPIVDEVCKETGNPTFVIRRNADQRFAAKQYDLIGIPWLAIEIKRVENLSGIGSWWKQTLAATLDGQIPVLIYRPNRKPWKVRMRVPVLASRMSVTMTVDTDMESFKLWFRWMLHQKLDTERNDSE